jgi:hypothetical protein
MNTAKRTKYLEQIAKQKLDNEPKINAVSYTKDLMTALNYYNTENDNREKKKWALAHIAAIDPAVADAVDKVDDFYFRQYGALARLISRGQELSDGHIKRMSEMLEEIKERAAVAAASPKAKAATTQVITVQDKTLEKAREIAGEIEGEIDDFVTSGCPKDYKLKTPVKGYGAPIVKYLSTCWVPLRNELEGAIAGDDEQLVEGYGNFKKMELKRFLSFVDSIIQECQQRVITAKAMRKPRATKQKPATVVAAKVKYMPEFAEHLLKSEHPSKMVNSDEVWIYNTKYRRLTVYKPADGGVLSIKGTTITNFDINTSSSKTLRKPEMIRTLGGMTKRPLNSAFKALTTKPTTPNGRINEECIILRVF